MVAVAAQVAKAAATTATVGGAMESLPATISIATTVAAPVAETAGAATVIPAVTEAMGGVTKAVETGVKTAEVALPDALSAATTIDATLKTGTAAPEAAMKNLVAAPVTDVENAGNVVGIKEIVAPDAAIEAQWADQKHTEIFRAVQPQITEWEKANPPGDDIPGWIERRSAAERQFTVNEAVNRDIDEWKSRNQDLEKTNHEKWEKDLAAETAKSRKENETSYDQFLAQQQEKNQGMSKQEFMRRYARLLQLRAIADRYAMNLQRLRVSAHKTPEYKAGLAQAEAQLESQRAEIELLEGELQFDAIKSGSVWKQYIIPAAVGIAMVAGPMGAAANEA